MERHQSLVGSELEFHNYQSGCLLRILHIIIYHQKYNARKIKVRAKGRKDAFCCTKPKTLSLERQNGEEEENIANDSAQPVQQQMEENATASSNLEKLSCVHEEIIPQKFGSQSVEFSRHSRSSSVHDCCEPGAYRKTPIVILQRASDSNSNNLYPLSCEPTNHVTISPCPQATSTGLIFNEYVESLDIIQVNKRLLEMLQDSDYQAASKKPASRHNSVTKLKLNRSGSFPVDKSFSKWHPKCITLEHKMRETWSVPKLANNPSQALQLAVPSSNPEVSTTRVVLDCAGDELHRLPEVTHSSKKKYRASSVVNYIIYLTNKIKHGLRQGKKQKEFTLCDEFVSVDPYQIKSSSIDRSVMKVQTDAGADKSSDFDKFLENCSKLLDNGSNTKASKLRYKSQSLKLTNSSSQSRGLKRFSRRLSMPPDLEYLVHYSGTFSNGESKSQKIVPKETTLDESMKAETSTLQHSARPDIENFEKQSECTKGSKREEDTAKLQAIPAVAVEEIQLLQEVAVTDEDDIIVVHPDSNDTEENQSPVSVLETRFTDKVEDMQFRVSEGLTVETTTAESHMSLAEDCGTRSESNNDIESKATAATRYRSINPVSSWQDQSSDSQYVLDVLYFSGFLEEECLATWYSLDRPLNPQFFHELEAILYLGENHSSHRQVLFDLVNDALFQIFESTLAYFPQHFSSMRRVRPLPKGRQVQAEVWSRVSWWKTYGGKIHQSLNDTTAMDFSSDDGWMVLQFDGEDVALDVEDVIFDELVTQAVVDLL